MNYYSLVDINDKRVYSLGTMNNAKRMLPFFAHKFKERPVLIFGDETHEELADKYCLKLLGGECESGVVELIKLEESGEIDFAELGEILMSNREFYEIFRQIGGNVITNLEDFIRYKYDSGVKSYDA